MRIASTVLEQRRGKDMRLEVAGMIGENCITLADGERLYQVIHPVLSNGQAVEVDFEGVKVFASPFFNAAFGQLFKDVAPDDLKRLLSVTSMMPAGRSVLKRVIENSKQYYFDADARKALDNVLDEESRG